MFRRIGKIRISNHAGMIVFVHWACSPDDAIRMWCNVGIVCSTQRDGLWGRSAGFYLMLRPLPFCFFAAPAEVSLLVFMSSPIYD